MTKIGGAAPAAPPSSAFTWESSRSVGVTFYQDDDHDYVEILPVSADRRATARLTMMDRAADLASRLAREAEAVCRRYLSNGHRSGRYWIVGDVRNTSGRSMFVRLTGPRSGKGAAGKWTDAATGEHGDLLDVIRMSCGLDDFNDAAEEARQFLSLPRNEPRADCAARRQPAPVGSPESARRLFAISKPIGGTLAETYLRARGITALHETGSLRFHPRCYYRSNDHSPTETWPALIAAVTDLDGRLTGAHRTWLDPNGYHAVSLGKAPLDTPRRAMGDLLGYAVRFGPVRDIMAAGEGIETVLSLRTALPRMPMAAALSAAHLAAVLLPATLRRLYVARDDDPAGDGARDALIERARGAGIDAIALSPRCGDFNDDLRLLGIDALRESIRIQIAPADVMRFMESRRVLPVRGEARTRCRASHQAGLSVASRSERAAPTAFKRAIEPSSGAAPQWLRPAIFRREPPNPR